MLAEQRWKELELSVAVTILFRTYCGWPLLSILLLAMVGVGNPDPAGLLTGRSNRSVYGYSTHLFLLYTVDNPQKSSADWFLRCLVSRFGVRLLLSNQMPSKSSPVTRRDPGSGSDNRYLSQGVIGGSRQKV
jgi:hypothetical protein